MTAFSSSAGRLAAMQSLASAQDYQKQIRDALLGGQQSALMTLGQAVPQQQAALQGGYNAAQDYYKQAADRLAPYAQTGLDAWRQYADAAGVYGKEGADRAHGNFVASPGYDWNVKETLDKTNRAAGAAGELYSGNTAAALQDRASNLANQEYQTYVNNLQGVSDRGYNAVGAQAGVDQARGGLGYQYGADQGNIIGNAAGQQAGIYTNTAQGIGSSLANLGQQTIDAYGNVAKAKTQADTNALNAWIAGANALSNTASNIYKPKFS